MLHSPTFLEGTDMSKWQNLIVVVLVLFPAVSICWADEKGTTDSSKIALTSYSMDVNIFPQTHLLKVKATLTLTSKKVGVVQLRFKIRKQFRVETITQADKPLEFTQNNWNVTIEGIQVAQNPPPLVWYYQGTFKPPFKSDSMSDVILYAGEIRLTCTSHWYPEPAWSPQLVIKPSSRLSVEVPERFSVVSGDVQEHQPRQCNGRILYRYASHTHGSLSFVATQYTKTAIPWKDKIIEAYFFPKKPEQRPKLIVTKFPQEEKEVLETLETARDILDFYSNKFSTYPWSRFALVQKSSRVAYAYGVQTYVVMNKLTYPDEKTFAHEIAHQWWGNLIHPVGQGERWLTESLAEYSAFLYMEHAHGSKKVVEDRREFLLSQMQNIYPIRQTSFNTPNYGNIVFKIGPHVFHMLRYVVGDKQFLDIMKTFAEQYDRQNATVDDFIEVAERVHKKSLDWFFGQWLDRTKNPAFVLESQIAPQTDNTFLVSGTIAQHNTDYQMPLEIEIIGKDQRENRQVWVQGSTTSFEYRVPYKPSQVNFAEEMTFWVLADFFHGEQEHLVTLKDRPKPPPSRSKEELFQLIRNKITEQRAYKLGTEIELELEANQAARLDCAENPYAYKEILICPMEGTLHIWTFYTDGSSSGGGKRLASGYSNRGRSKEVRNITVWEIRDNKAHIKFRAETDKEKIKQTFKKMYEKRGMIPKEIQKRLEKLFPR
jgi:hypothetical protein